MPTIRSLAAALTLALTAISCSDNQSPTAPADKSSAELAPARRPVATGPIVQQVTNLAVTAANGTTGLFTGTLTITSFATNAAGDLLANGTLVGNLVGSITGGATTAVNQTFTNLLVDAGRCPILALDVGRIFLDLLGLQLDVAPISIDLTAVAGPGNLLGNLLCALVGILDQNPLAGAVANLLNQINAILAGI
ncbi:MAG TPA: hypothetical protein VF252_13820 [Gemmatimonadales bacterium]